MKRLAALLLLCPIAASSADNPLLGHWRSCHSAEGHPYQEELEFHGDGTVLYSSTTYHARDCTSPRAPTRSFWMTYSFLREENPDVVSLELTSDHLNLTEDADAWFTGYATFLSSETMSLRITNFIAIRDGKPVHVSPEEISGQPTEVFTRDSATGSIELRRDMGRLWEALDLADRAGARRQAAEIRLELGDFAGAEADLAILLKDRPDDFDLLLMSAKARRDRPDAALPYAERAARAGAAGPRLGAAHLLASELRLDLGDAAGAEKSAELAAVEAPGDLDALHALVRLKRARKPEALAYAERAERAAAAAPLWRRAAAARAAARVWLELDEHSRAAGCLRRALELNPVDIDALGLAAGIKARLSAGELAGFRRAAPAAPERQPSGAEDAERALARDPNDLEALRSLAALSLSRGLKPQAEALVERFTRAVWKTPLWQQAEAYRTAAKIWIELGRSDRAAQSLAKAHALQQDALETQQLGASLPRGASEAANVDASISIYIFCRAAELRLALDDRAGAEALLARALALQPDHGWALRLKSELKKIPAK